MIKHFFSGSVLWQILGITTCVTFMACENNAETVKNLSKKKKMVDEAYRVESFYSQEGKMKARLTAPVMLTVREDTSYIEFPKSLHVDFYNDSTFQVESKLDSKYGKYYETYNKVYLKDSVLFTTTKGDTLKCMDLWWDQNKAIFYTDNYALYKGPENFIQGGKGLVITQDLKTRTFKNISGYHIMEDGWLQ